MSLLASGLSSCAKWYQKQPLLTFLLWRDGRRAKAKVGDYPSMPLVQAREVFERDDATLIQKGCSVKIVTDTRPGTVADSTAMWSTSRVTIKHPGWRPTRATLC
jgi:hypothetical protein